MSICDALVRMPRVRGAFSSDWNCLGGSFILHRDLTRSTPQRDCPVVSQAQNIDVGEEFDKRVHAVWHPGKGELAQWRPNLLHWLNPAVPENEPQSLCSAIETRYGHSHVLGEDHV